MRNLFVLLILICTLPVMAAEHQLRDHSCQTPIRPIDDQNDRLWQKFLDEIDAYRDCINREMEWHQQAARDHQARAKVVVDEWNRFVTNNLNAPEDFPWPPEE